MTAMTVEQARTAVAGDDITVAGLLTSVTHQLTSLDGRHTLQSRPWATAYLQGGDTAVQLLLFPDIYERLLPLLTVGNRVVADAQVNLSDQQMVSLSVHDLRIDDSESAR